MQTAARMPRSSLDFVDDALQAERRAVLDLLGRAGLSRAAAGEAADSIDRDAWTALLAAGAPLDPSVPVRRAGLRAAAEALRRAGAGLPADAEPTPIPAGLTPEALRGAQLEVIPGRRSVAGMHLRGFRAEELAPVYGLGPGEMRERLAGALQDLRSSLHRRAERMKQAGWSRGLEAQPLEETFGMLRERPADGASRLRCPEPAEMAEAVNGTHFRGGREGVLDHAVHCDPCAAELRALLALRGVRRPEAGPPLDAAGVEGLQREARSRPELRSLAAEAAAPAPRRRRRLWPWLLLLAGGLLLLRLLL